MSKAADALHVDTRSECTERKISFDGIEPLKYASVAGPVDVYRQPGDCPAKSVCRSAWELPAGASVAVGKTCGTWAFIQEIDVRSIRYGWVPGSALSVREPPGPPPPWPDGTPIMQQRYAFHLITSRGRPVCEAYLQRLNQTVFGHPPYCTRPESAIVPGFELLHRQPIGQTKFLALELEVELLLYKHPSSPEYPPKYQENYHPATWRYDPPVSVENNGQPDNLVIWDPEDGNAPLCGFPYGPRAIPEGGLLAPFILTADDKAVDLAKTQEIFGRPNVSLESNAAPSVVSRK